MLYTNIAFISNILCIIINCDISFLPTVVLCCSFLIIWILHQKKLYTAFIMRYILPMQGMLRTQISRHEWLCAIGFFSLYLYINASIILRFGMHFDEMLDFDGSKLALHTYLCYGRWGLAVWSKLVGSGYIPLAGGITAGVILTIAYLMQCRLLFFRKMKERALFGIISLACIQFYCMQLYSMQVEGVALGILLATLSCVVLLAANIKAVWRIVISVLILFCSLSFYQTCGVYFIVLYGFALLARALRGETFNVVRCGATVVTVCVCALASFMVTKNILLYSCSLNSDALDLCREHEDAIFAYSLFAADVSELGREIKVHIHDIVGVILHCNSRIAIFWGVCAMVLLVRVFQSSDSFREKLKRTCLCVLTLGVPLGIYTCFLTHNYNSYLFLPLLEAGTCTLALKGLRIPRWGNVLLALFLALSCIKASHSVARAAARERAVFEHIDISLKLKYTEACRYALSRGMNPRKTRILVVEGDSNTKKVDFYGRYPLYPNFHLATWRDWEKHADIIQQMPTWPAEGSIAESQGEIIINTQGR